MRSLVAAACSISALLALGGSARAEQGRGRFTVWDAGLELGTIGAVTTTHFPPRDDDQSNARGAFISARGSLFVMVARWVAPTYRPANFRMSDWLCTDLALGTTESSTGGSTLWTWGRGLYGAQAVYAAGPVELAVRGGFLVPERGSVGGFGSLFARYRFVSLQVTAGSPSLWSGAVRVYSGRGVHVGLLVERFEENQRLREGESVTNWHGRAFVGF